MKYTHIHLIINHFTLYLCIFFVVFRTYRTFNGQAVSPKINLGLQLFLVIFLLILNFTGHQAEHQIASFLQDPDGSYMYTHEEWGEFTIQMAFLNLIFHVLALKFHWAKSLSWISLILLTFSLIVTSFWGGQLAHPEIR